MTESSHLSLPIRLITLNIRYATESPVPGEETWQIRCLRLCAQLKFLTSGHDSAFVCLQEVLHSQLTDIQERLGLSWDHTGNGREDGDRAGEYSPIFYRADRWECERSRTFWLSPTPHVPSRGWDAALKRIVTVGSFCHRDTGTVVVLMSTHLDHRGVLAREESSRLLLTLAKSWTEIADSAPHPSLFLGGDFNSTPTGKAYKILTEPGSRMSDISRLVAEDAKYGNREITYTSFGEPNSRPARIDFLFVRDAARLRFSTFGIPSNKFDDEVYLSDHRPVVADIEVPVKPAI